MDNTAKTEEKKGRVLTDEERLEKVEGDLLFAMTRMPGWKIIERILTRLAFHSWADPMETKKLDEWAYMELNSYYAAHNAKELLREIQDMMNRADWLAKVENGEVEDVKKFQIGR